VKGLRYHIRNHVELAQQFADWIIKDHLFELAAPAPLNLVCFRHKGGDVINQKLLARLNQSGKLYLTHTVLHDRFTLRLCVGQTHTDARHVKQAWVQIRQIAHELSNS
jgi:aromatic-L-amino-acid decarboxylase